MTVKYKIDLNQKKKKITNTIIKADQHFYINKSNDFSYVKEVAASNKLILQILQFPSALQSVLASLTSLVWSSDLRL